MEACDIAPSLLSGLPGPLYPGLYCECGATSEHGVDRPQQNPAYAPLARSVHITITEASYQTTLAIVTSGVIGLILSPVSNVYGRRPIYIYVSTIGIAAGAGCAVAKTWGSLIAARVFVGVGTAPGMAIGAAAVSDMYFMHERGR